MGADPVLETTEMVERARKWAKGAWNPDTADLLTDLAAALKVEHEARLVAEERVRALEETMSELLAARS
jgi:hypothetical protein